MNISYAIPKATYIIIIDAVLQRRDNVEPGIAKSCSDVEKASFRTENSRPCMMRTQQNRFRVLLSLSIALDCFPDFMTTWYDIISVAILKCYRGARLKICISKSLIRLQISAFSPLIPGIDENEPFALEIFDGAGKCVLQPFADKLGCLAINDFSTRGPAR